MPTLTTEQPDHSEIRQRVLQAWDDYHTAGRAHADASAAVTAALAAARASGVTMYRMAKWLKVTQRSIQVRLEKHDQTNTPPPPPPT